MLSHPAKYLILPLHGMISTDQQRLIFSPPKQVNNGSIKTARHGISLTYPIFTLFLWRMCFSFSCLLFHVFFKM